MMVTSDNGIELISRFEGLRLTAYQDTGGIWTIGYGHTRGVTRGQQITPKQAITLLRQDVGEAERDVARLIDEATPDQFDAMVSLTFNVGVGNFQSSTVLRKHNEGDYEHAADAFLLWNKGTVGGRKVVLAGLVKRRRAERALYSSDQDWRHEMAK